MKHFIYAAMFTGCLDLYKPPVGSVVCMTIATARGLIYMRNEKRNCTSQDIFFPS